MGTNSIRAGICKESIISEINLLLGEDIEQRKVFLIVEGIDDINLLRKLVNKNVTILESFSGKSGIKEIIEEHFNNNNRVIGIRDRDYEVKKVHDQIFYYDFCCMEMMLVNHDEVFSNLVYEYYDSQFKLNDFRLAILKQLKFVSLLRKYNEVYGWGIKIKGISLHKLLNKRRKEIPITDTIKRINKISSDFFELNKDKYNFLINQYDFELSYNELLFITQGHDFLCIFSEYCKKSKGAAISDKNIGKTLRCNFRGTDFKTTCLYSDIHEFEKNNSLKIVF